jgi:hypothetical protein
MGNWLGLVIGGSVAAGVLVAGLLVFMRMPGETCTGPFLPLTKTENCRAPYALLPLPTLINKFYF